MPVLAGWLTGEQVPQETIEETLSAMSDVLGQHGGQPARSVLPGAGIIAFSDDGYAMQHNDDPPVLDWVPDRRTLVYRRPLSGAHVLYYVEDWPAQGNLLFASEIKALLAVGVPRRLHIAALDALLRYGFIPAPWTAFKDIRVVPAGSILRWQKAKTVVNTSTDYHLDEPLSCGNISEQLHALLNAAIAGMPPPHEQLVALTPGDALSALPALLTAQHAPARFPIVAFDYTNSVSQIWKSAERVAAACQRPFLEVMGVDEPEFWVATLAGLEAPSIDTRPLLFHQLLHTVANETEARVAISGSGAHILAGPAVPTQPLATNSEQAGMLSWYRNTLLEEPGKRSTQIWSREVAELLQKEERWEETLHARKLARRAEQFADRQQGWYYLDLHLRLPDLAVHPAQQLAMQERMVVRSPYLNAHVIDMLTRLPATLADGTSKEQLLTQLARRYMPARTKLGTVSPLIVPMNSLLDIEGSDLLRQTLSPEALRASGIFDPGVVEELLKMQEKGKRELLLVFTAQLFWRLFEMEV
jgi:asparagine synthase (glutamine-hydrolysing)